MTFHDVRSNCNPPEVSVCHPSPPRPLLSRKYQPRTLSSPDYKRNHWYEKKTTGFVDTKVDLPSPDSPTTIRLNSKPFLTAFLYTCIGYFPCVKERSLTYKDSSTKLWRKYTKIIHLIFDWNTQILHTWSGKSPNPTRSVAPEIGAGWLGFLLLLKEFLVKFKKYSKIHYKNKK